MAQARVCLVAVQILSLGLAIALQPHGADAEDRRASEIQESFPIDPWSDLFFVPVRIAGKTYEFGLDTGTGVTVLDRSLRPRLGEAQGVCDLSADEDSVTSGLYRTPGMKIGRGSLAVAPDELVACVDLAWLRQVTGHRMFGVIGVPALRRSVIRIDFDRRRLNVLDPKVGGRNWGESFRFDYNSSGQIVVAGAVAGNIRESFILDTGCTSTGSLRRSTFDRLADSRRLAIVGLDEVADVARSSSQPVGRVAEFCFGTFRHEKLLFDRSESSKVGLSYLRRFKVTLDFPAKRLYLLRGAHYDEPDLHNSTGLHLIQRDGTTEVAMVDSNSPAEVAGFRPGDEVVTIQGRKAAALTLSEIRHVLGARDGDNVPIAIRRGGRIIEVTLHVRLE
ncbi:MAG: PDZ domain-containing protein [Thermoguttaceae bacterium]|jgi:hypothetical protein